MMISFNGWITIYKIKQRHVCTTKPTDERYKNSVFNLEVSCFSSIVSLYGRKEFNSSIHCWNAACIIACFVNMAIKFMQIIIDTLCSHDPWSASNMINKKTNSWTTGHECDIMVPSCGTLVGKGYRMLKRQKLMSRLSCILLHFTFEFQLRL